MTHLQGPERARYVQSMFARIAGRYDLMNRLMTFGQDVRWRRYVIRQAQLPPRGRLLDIATGTGDIAYEGVRQHPQIQSVGGDFTIEMMQVGKRYPQRRALQWVGADTLALPFADHTFDAVTSGFLMRNVVDVPGALREQRRVTRPGGRVVILESSPPKRNLLRPFIRLHLNYVIPLLGRLLTGEAEAYRYLPDTTQQFQDPESLATLMREAGLGDVSYRLFMFGTIAVHVGVNPRT
ncbi:MAG TPA: ubiquinone/menaquinone biosynthesis methyltransferase [Candidatus Sulfomarinibacteraceae bacterium]|nr:ubiquinone/menaquinone biosynthesis methyltransferase [Candidatus Sulfomarinibacteraceae bacterium]